MFCMANKGKAPTLKELAENWCTRSGLSSPTGHKYETDLLDNVQTGKPTTLSGNESIRGELIRFLCGNPDAQKLVDPCGIVIKGARITGEKVSRYEGQALLLSSLKIPFPLILNNCTLPPWLLLQGAEIPFLELDGCIVTSIDADVLKIRGDLHMRNKFQSTGNLNLSGVTIGGDLDLSGATLAKGKDPLDPRRRNASLSAEGIHVSGDIRMTDFWVEDSASGACTGTPTQPSTKPQGKTLHFKSNGTICLDGAHIDGDITCDGGQFGDPTPGAELVDALTLRHASIGGDVLMGRGFASKGAVRLPGAIIGGDMDCGNGKFDNPWYAEKLASGIALELDGTEIKLDLNLSHGKERVHIKEDATEAKADEVTKTTKATTTKVFRANGTVSLTGTRVGRELHCASGYFLNNGHRKDECERNQSSIATNPQIDKSGNATNTPSVYPADNKASRWRPALDLRNARVAYLNYFDSKHLDDNGDVHLKTGELLLDGFVYDRISRGTKKWDLCLKWIDKQSPKSLSDFAPQPYLQLAKVLREEGDISGARKVLYEMEKNRSKHLWKDLFRDFQTALKLDYKKIIGRPQTNPDAPSITPLLSFRGIRSYLSRALSVSWRFLTRRTIGYGYYSFWALGWLAVIWLAGALVFDHKEANMVPTDKNAYEAAEICQMPLPGNYVAFNPFLYSLENTLPIIKLGQTSFWQPRPTPLPPPYAWLHSSQSGSSLPGCLGVVRSLQIAAGWFLTTIGVAGLTGLIRKD